jgi:hypothetical protein
MMIIDNEELERAMIEDIMTLRDLENKYKEAHTDRWRATLDGRIAKIQKDIGYQIHYAFIENLIEFK